MTDEDEAWRREEAERRESMERLGPGERSPGAGGPEERGERGRIRWGRIFGYVVILVTVVTVLTAVFGEIGYSVRDELVAKGRTGEGLFLALALSAVGIVSVVAAQVATYAVLAYGTPGRAPVHVFLAWLLFTLIGTVLSSWDSVAGWAVGSLLGAAYALVGLGIGVGLRRALGGRDGARRAFPRSVLAIFVVLACLPIVGAVSVWVYAVAAEPGSGAGAGTEGEVIRGTRDSDTLEGGEGDDEIHGGPGGDTLIGRGGDDRLHGEDGPDEIDGGGGGENLLYGGRGPDTIYAGFYSGSDTIESKGGDDTIYVDDGVRDNIDCGPGTDRVRSDSQDDLTYCEESF